MVWKVQFWTVSCSGWGVRKLSWICVTACLERIPETSFKGQTIEMIQFQNCIHQRVRNYCSEISNVGWGCWHWLVQIVICFVLFFYVFFFFNWTGSKWTPQLSVKPDSFPSRQIGHKVLPTHHPLLLKYKCKYMYVFFPIQWSLLIRTPLPNCKYNVLVSNVFFYLMSHFVSWQQSIEINVFERQKGVVHGRELWSVVSKSEIVDPVQRYASELGSQVKKINSGCSLLLPFGWRYASSHE